MSMSAGKYYVGDLCYVMHPQWDEVCDITCDSKEHSTKDGEFTLKNGVKFAMYGTMYGDGCYTDQSGKSEYGVDSGTIGCIKVEDINDAEGIERMEELGHIHDFKQSFRTGAMPDGTIWFGGVRIGTGG